MKRYGTLWFAASLALLTLVSEAGGLPRIVATIAGPAVVASVAVWVLSRRSTKQVQKILMLVALGLSCLADVFLGLDGMFEVGLLLFLLMHLCYIAVFSLRGAWNAWLILPLMGYAAVAGIVLGVIWINVAKVDMIVPVIVYVGCVTLMAALAFSAMAGEGAQMMKRSAALGGGLFFISDVLVAFDRFGFENNFAGLWVLPLYWVGQTLIAGSFVGEDV